MSERIKQAILKGGSLHSYVGRYLHWTPGNEDATLDGRFTAQELREIADYMEAHREEEKDG